MINVSKHSTARLNKVYNAIIEKTNNNDNTFNLKNGRVVNLFINRHQAQFLDEDYELIYCIDNEEGIQFENAVAAFMIELAERDVAWLKKMC